MKLNALITALAKKANIDITDAKFAGILATETDIPDELANAIESGLMSEAAAVANFSVRNKIRAEVYNGIDKDVESLLEEFEFDEKNRTAVLSEKKASDRMKKLASILQEQSKAAEKSGNPTKAAALEKQVEDLNKQIKTLTQTHQQKLDQLAADNENAQIGFSVKSILSSKKLALPETMSAEEKVEMVHGIINKELQAKGLKVIRENGVLKLQKQDGTDPYDDKNNRLELPSLIDGALAQRGLLKVSDKPNPGRDGKETPETVPGGGVTPESNKQFINELDAEIAELTKDSTAS
jgi:hypothetical protein